MQIQMYCNKLTSHTNALYCIVGLLQYQIVIRMYKWTRIESSWTKTQLHWKDPDRVEQWNLSSGYTQGGILSVEKALGIWVESSSEHTAAQRYVWEMCFSKVHFWNVCFFKVYFSKVWRSSECKDQDRVEKWNGSRSESSCCHFDTVFKSVRW